jgi:hypothetical protein
MVGWQDHAIRDVAIAGAIATRNLVPPELLREARVFFG